MEAIACTVPTASTTTGIAFFPIVVTTTGTAPPGLARPRRPCGCAMAAGLAEPFSAALAAAPKPSLWATSSRKIYAAPQTATAITAKTARRTIRIPDSPVPQPQGRIICLARPAAQPEPASSPRILMQKTRHKRAGFSTLVPAAAALLPAVVLDDQRRLHLDRIGHVGKLGPAHVGALHVLVVGGDVFRHVALGGLRGFQHPRHLLGLGRELDHVIVLHKVRSDVDPLAVHLDVTMAHQLAAGEHGDGEFHAVDDGVQPALQQLDQVLAGVALAAHGLEIIAAQLAFGDRAVIALQPLLGHQLQAVVGWLLAALAVLAGAVFALVDRALGTAPQVDPEAAVDLVLRLRAFAHADTPSLCVI